MESYILPNFPREFSLIHLCLFQNVTNSASLRTRLVQAATMNGEKGDEERDVMDFGFVEASMVRCRVFVRYDTEQKMDIGRQPGTYLDGNLPSSASRLK
jgi:EKC/KEOPS complex subunit CGI121/TPRKB